CVAGLCGRGRRPAAIGEGIEIGEIGRRPARVRIPPPRTRRRIALGHDWRQIGLRRTFPSAHDYHGKDRSPRDCAANGKHAPTLPHWLRDFKSLHAAADLDATAHGITTMFSSAVIVLPSSSCQVNRKAPLSSIRAANARYGFSATAVSRSHLNTRLPLNSQVNVLMILRGMMLPFASRR